MIPFDSRRLLTAVSVTLATFSIGVWHSEAIADGNPNTAEPIENFFDEAGLVEGVGLKVRRGYDRTPFEVEIQITSANEGGGFHGWGTVPLRDGTVLADLNDQIFVTIPWDQDEQPMHEGAMYTTCARLLFVDGSPGEWLSNPTGVVCPVSSDHFNVIQAGIDLEESAIEVPVPVYEQVDVLGDYKNGPDSIACGGGVSEGVAEDADDCLLRPQLSFTNGYLDTNGTVVTPNAATYNGEFANLEISGDVGDIVELTVNNKLPLAQDGEALGTAFFAPADNLQTVHWQGMELDNESDGTPVTETGIEPGYSRLYRFRLYRPGPFAFEPHILPLLSVSRGMAGRLIVHSEAEHALELLGVLPETFEAFTLTDFTVANEINKFVFDGGVVFQNFTDEEVDNHLLPDITPDLDGDGVCDRGPGDCIVQEGELVAVNGVVPTGDADIPTVYVRQGGGARLAFINSSAERFYRLRLLLDGEAPPAGAAERVNRPTTGQCYADAASPKFSGADPLSCDQGLPLYRVGGEGGLLDHVRLEGQPELAAGEAARDFDTVIRTGEDFIAPGDRTELVILTKDRNGNYLQVGDSLFIWTVDYPHGLFGPRFDNRIGDGRPRNRDITPRKLVRIEVVPNVWELPDYTIAADDPLLAHPDVDRPTENIKTVAATALSAVPGVSDSAGNPFAGSTDPSFLIDNHVIDGTRFPSISGVRGEYAGTSGIIGDFLPTQDGTRYARVGDVIELVYANNTGGGHHPLRLHGFSFQPISIHNFAPVDTNFDGTNDSATLEGTAVYEYDYNEFIDTVSVQPGKALKLRVKLNDRFQIPDAAAYSPADLSFLFPYDKTRPYGGAGDVDLFDVSQMGGSVGRWLLQSRILHHAGLGRVTDLCVAPQDDADASGCKVDIDEGATFPTPP